MEATSTHLPLMTMGDSLSEELPCRNEGEWRVSAVMVGIVSYLDIISTLPSNLCTSFGQWEGVRYFLIQLNTCFRMTP